MDSLRSEKAINGKNQQVFDHLVAFAKQALAKGVETFLWTWNPADGKGIDDLIQKNKLPMEIDLRTGSRQIAQVRIAS